MANVKTVPGSKWGRLTVAHATEPHKFMKNGKPRLERRVFCNCECGGEWEGLASNLTTGNTTSCGCYRVAVAEVKNRTHGQASSRTYRIYRHMINRCYNPKVERFPLYGGRGVMVAEEWRGSGGYERFMAHIGEPPSAAHTLDRIDPNGHYIPGNVRWATVNEQAANKRNTLFVDVGGTPKRLAEAAKELGVSYHKLYHQARSKPPSP